MPTLEAEGTQACTIGVEHTLATSTDVRSFLLVLDLSPLQSGDTIEIRLKRKVRNTGTLRTAYKVSVTDALGSDDQVWQSVPLSSTSQFSATIKQTAGTGRSIDWALESV